MKLKKILAGVLAAAMLALTACSGTGDNEMINPNNAVGDAVAHYQTGTLHKVSVSESDTPFVTDGKTDYTIVVPAGEDYALTAANYISACVFKAAGAYPEIEEYDGSQTYSADKTYVVLNVEPLFKSAGLSMPSDALGQTGYYIKTAGRSVFLMVNHNFGYQYAALAFLKHAVGYNMYSYDYVTYSKDGKTLPAMDIVEKPDFELHLQSNRTMGKERYGMGYLTTGNVFISVDGVAWHNSFKWLPKDTYKNEYGGKWYSDGGQQLCYTAHGDPEAYNAMLLTSLEKAKTLLAANPNIGAATFTIQDASVACECKACMDKFNKYGTHSAAVVHFMNDLGALIDEYLESLVTPENPVKRDFTLVFFAYFRTTQPPVKEENLMLVPIDDSVVCRDNVGVYIAPIGAQYNKSFYDEANTSTANVIRGWSALSDKLYMWLYETNFSYYMYPLNSYDTMIETYRFCKENNAVYMYNEGQHNQGRVTHFTSFKEYVDSKAQFDVNVRYTDLLDDFFGTYYGAGGTAMRTFFDELQIHLKYLEENFETVTGSIYLSMEKPEYWPKRTLDHWVDLCNRAYEEIKPLLTTDPELYNVYYNHILLESMFPRYALLRMYSGTFSKNEFMKEAAAFRNDCTNLNITKVSEGGNISSIFTGWGL